MNDRGIPVVLLGVNNEAELAAGVALGVNAMLTDRPEWFTAQKKRPAALKHVDRMYSLKQDWTPQL